MSKVQPMIYKNVYIYPEQNIKKWVYLERSAIVLNISEGSVEDKLLDMIEDRKLD